MVLISKGHDATLLGNRCPPFQDNIVSRLNHLRHPMTRCHIPRQKPQLQYGKKLKTSIKRNILTTSHRVLGYIHIHKGPNKVGFVGIFQPFRDAINP